MISVIMPCYKEQREIFLEALESIRQQTYYNIEIIIIMNGHNVELENTVYDYCKIDNRILFYKNERNMGLAYSLNKGINLAHGDYIARMDSDDIAIPTRLEKEINYLKENDLDFVGTYYETIDDFGRHIGVVKGPINNDDIYNTLTEYDCVGHPTWLLKKEVYNRLNGYGNFSCAEDYHFLLKARIAGVKIGVLPECCLRYRKRLESDSHVRAAEFYVTADYFRKNRDDIFKITPEILEQYINSDKGQRGLREAEEYQLLLKKYHEKKWLLPFYGVRFLFLSIGRWAIKHKILQWMGLEKRLEYYDK